MNQTNKQGTAIVIDSTATSKTSSISATDLREMLHRQSLFAEKVIASSRKSLIHTRERLAVERSLRMELTARLEALQSSAAYNITRRLESLLPEWMFQLILRVLTRACRLTGVVVREARSMAATMFPFRTVHPLMIYRSVMNDGFADAMIQLPGHCFLPSKKLLKGPDRAFSYSFKCTLDTLAEILLYLDTSGVREGAKLRVQICCGEVLIQDVSTLVLTGSEWQPTLIQVAPIHQSRGKRYTLRLMCEEGQDGSFPELIVFRANRFKRVPWRLSKEVQLTGLADGGDNSFVPRFLAEGSDDYEIFTLGWSPNPEIMQYAPLYGDRSVRWSFQAPEVSLDSIQVVFGTYNRVNKATLRVEISTETGQWRSECPTALIKDNQYFSLPICPNVLQQIKGCIVSLSLSSPDASPDDQVAVMGAFRSAEAALTDEKDSLPVGEIRKFSKSYSDSPHGPVFRQIFTDSRESKKLRVGILLSPSYSQWWVNLVVRNLEHSFTSAGHQVEIFSSLATTQARETLARSDILLVIEQPYTDLVRSIVTEVRCSYGLAIACSPSQFGPLLDDSLTGSEALPFDEQDLVKACGMVLDFTVGPGEEHSQSMGVYKSTLPLNPHKLDVQRWLLKVMDRHRKTMLPRVSVVTVLYRKAREIPHFLKALALQDYAGEVELVVVDDQSPDNSKDLLLQSYEILQNEGLRLPELKLLTNPTNIGNCGSRNRALTEITGDVVVIVDSDCLLNKSFLSAHVYSHIFHEADVVIGPCNLETGAQEPLESLADFEHNRDRIMREAQLQDSTNLDSFVNCITRNFSIHRRNICEDLFDDQFSYSAHPDSGFGWEDVEMGYRLYKRGLRIYFTTNAFSVHISHPSSTDDTVKPLKSLKNFRRLLAKHPSIRNDARRWYLDTFKKIEKWSEACGHQLQDNQLAIRESVSPMYPYPFFISGNRRLRILSYRWHVPHQYELYKLPYEFTLLNDLGTGFTATWDFEQRPLPHNAVLRSLAEINVKDFDLFILHFDENVLIPENCNGVISADWGASFKWAMENIKELPRVAVCHGTPQFIGQYNQNYHEADLGTPIEQSRQLMVDYLGDVPVVCNSYQAGREWGFRNSRIIWQGFDPSEFRGTNYEGGILTLGRSIEERPHYRGFEHLRRVTEILPDGLRPELHSVKKPILFGRHTNTYARLKYEAYLTSLRAYSVYFNPTLRSPMPRTRGEAMMSGLVSVSAANHDVEQFIKNGWNGFYSNSSEELADYLRFLMSNKKACRDIGKRSRETAADVFNHDRYLFAWQSLVSEVVGG